MASRKKQKKKEVPKPRSSIRMELVIAAAGVILLCLMLFL